MPTSTKAATWFGSPDGAVEDLAFPAVPLQHVLLGPQTRINTASVIAGRLGAGKTFALRRLYLEGRKDKSRSTHLANQPPSMVVLADIAAASRTSFQTELWTDTWDRAMLVSLASHWDPDGHQLAEEFKDLGLSPSRREVSPYGALERLGHARSSHSGVIRALGHPSWDDIRYKLARISDQRPPLTMLIDSIDNSYSLSPALMMDCQKGLFYAVLRWDRNRDLAKRARMVVALRDLVVSAVMQSEHSARLLGAPDVAILDWSPGELMSMVMLRIAGSTGRNPEFTESEFLTKLAGELRLESIDRSAQIWARILDFSNGVPRDVITMLNALASQAERGPNIPAAQDRAIERAAKLLGRAKLALVSTEILMELTNMSRGGRAGEHGWWEPERSDSTLAIDGVSDQVVQVIRSSADPDYGEIDPNRLSEASQRYFSIDVTDILWRHALVGVVNRSRKRIHFRTASEWDTTDAPRRAGEVLAAHPSIGLVAQLAPGAAVAYSVDFGGEW